jgi:GNAT superfamily N-acetyltransferase
LLHKIQKERCTHSWRNIDPDVDLYELQDRENALRPTSIFFYFINGDKHDGREGRLAAAATVADGIRKDVPLTGFPVLARCFIMPEFRGMGLYKRILEHRLNFCRDRFQHCLKAVHMGTTNDYVEHSITQTVENWPPFLRVGSEALKIGNDICLVGAFLLFMPGYLADMARTLSGAARPPAVKRLDHICTLLKAGSSGDHALAIQENFKEACASGWFDNHDAAPIEQLLCFLRAMPLVGLEEKAYAV